MTRSIRAEIENRCRRELEGYRRLGTIEHTLGLQNECKVVVDPARPSTSAVMSLYAKGHKTFLAIEVLAREGFGEDAMILARSLTNLCIDLGYIASSDSDNRARQWLACGRVARRRLLREWGITGGDEYETDWTSLAELASRWRGVSIRKRAEDAHLLGFYDTAYRHGSVFEHSDSWSAIPFLDISDGIMSVTRGPGFHHVLIAALFAGACAFTQLVQLAGQFWGFDFEGHDTEMVSLIDNSFQPQRDGIGSP